MTQEIKIYQQQIEQMNRYANGFQEENNWFQNMVKQIELNELKQRYI